MLSLRLASFIKTDIVKDLEPVKFGIYNLKKVEKYNLARTKKKVKFILIYKLRSTHYKIHSATLFYTKVKRLEGKVWALSAETQEGFVEVRKGFNKTFFSYNHMPSAITVSVNKNLDRFNQTVKGVLAKQRNESKTKRRKRTDRELKDNFLNNLDT